MKNQELTVDSPLNLWVQKNLDRAAVLEEFGLDFCCGGHQTLAEACRDKGLDPAQVLARLQGHAPADSRTADLDWTEAPLDALVDHIEKQHHTYLKAALPQISERLDRVVAAHASRHPELKELAALFAELKSDLEPHLMKEERVLFPLIRQAAAKSQDNTGTGGEVRRPIAVMTAEHERAGALLAQIRETSQNYRVPDDGCASYQGLMAELRRLEEDTHLHIYLENAVLFPRAQGQALDLPY